MEMWRSVRDEGVSDRCQIWAISHQLSDSISWVTTNDKKNTPALYC